MAATAITSSTQPEQSPIYGQLWGYLEKKPGPDGIGHIYCFVEQDGINPFPAVEQSGEKFLERLQSSERLYEVTARLGYKVYKEGGRWFMELPTKEALLHGWEKLRGEDPNLPPLDIVECDGVLDDLSFAENFINRKIVLSRGCDFIHDHQAHVISAISHALHEGRSRRNLERARRWLKKAHHIIKQLSTMTTDARIVHRMHATLGAWADTLSAEGADSYRRGIPLLANHRHHHSFVIALWRGVTIPGWPKYFSTRFSHDQLPDREFVKFWQTHSVKVR